jgi:DNA-directed RNA polymerase subunit RPC12/RpoP
VEIGDIAVSTQWFYMKGGSPIGPISETVLQQLADAGELKLTDFVRREDQDAWVPFSKAPGFLVKDKVVPADDDGQGQIELDAGSRFLWTHPLGFPAWIVFLAFAILIFNVMMIKKDKEDRNEPAPGLIEIVDGTMAFAGLCLYFGMKRSLGKQTSCPHCKAWFSRLLIKSDARIISSQDGVRTYTAQVAIRDKNHQVTGYLDEERTVPVTIKTIQADRKYRCKSCQRRWESTEIGTVNR